VDTQVSCLLIHSLELAYSPVICLGTLCDLARVLLRVGQCPIIACFSSLLYHLSASCPIYLLTKIMIQLSHNASRSGPPASGHQQSVAPDRGTCDRIASFSCFEWTATECIAIGAQEGIRRRYTATTMGCFLTSTTVPVFLC
jgi:hypothetical protein